MKGNRLTLAERAIALFSPKWALERAAYRNLLRSYEAGEVNRFNDDWTPINEDTENADKTQRDLIKARARYLERNSDIANAAVGGIVRNVVGVGIKPQARTPSEDLNQEIEELWAEWTKPDNCDVTGQQSFYEMESMLLRRQIYDGEIFVKKVFDRRAAVPLKLQIIKSDLLSQYLLYAPGTNNVIRSGVELDEVLRPGPPEEVVLQVVEEGRVEGAAVAGGIGLDVLVGADGRESVDLLAPDDDGRAAQGQVVELAQPFLLPLARGRGGVVKGQIPARQNRQLCAQKRRKLTLRAPRGQIVLADHQHGARKVPAQRGDEMAAVDLGRAGHAGMTPLFQGLQHRAILRQPPQSGS